MSDPSKSGPQDATGDHTFWELVQSDVAAWGSLWIPNRAVQGRYGLWDTLRLTWGFVGLRASLLYRISHALRRRRVKVLPQMLWRLNIMLHGIDIPPRVPIGPRLYIPHPVGTVVMAERIGSGCTLVSGVTIGMRREPEFPIIGDNVYVGAGARVLGAITIGNNVQIGANAVVLQDVPDDSVAVGVPAQIRPAKRKTAESSNECGSVGAWEHGGSL